MGLLANAAAKFNVSFGTGIGQAIALLRFDLSTFKSLGEEAQKIPAQKAHLALPQCISHLRRPSVR
jgi:hypothetical protein